MRGLATPEDRRRVQRLFASDRCEMAHCERDAVVFCDECGKSACEMCLGPLVRPLLCKECAPEKES